MAYRSTKEKLSLPCNFVSVPMLSHYIYESIDLDNFAKSKLIGIYISQVIKQTNQFCSSTVTRASTSVTIQREYLNYYMFMS